eukprot:4842415-Pleurochrysis_carterae.AAC.1
MQGNGQLDEFLRLVHLKTQGAGRLKGSTKQSTIGQKRCTAPNEISKSQLLQQSVSAVTGGIKKKSSCRGKTITVTNTVEAAESVQVEAEAQYGSTKTTKEPKVFARFAHISPFLTSFKHNAFAVQPKFLYTCLNDVYDSCCPIFTADSNPRPCDMMYTGYSDPQRDKAAHAAQDARAVGGGARARETTAGVEAAAEAESPAEAANCT